MPAVAVKPDGRAVVDAEPGPADPAAIEAQSRRIA